MKRGLVVWVSLLMAVAAVAQEYKEAAGIRAGVSSGIEYRRYIDYEYSGMLLLSARNRGLQLHALFEIHRTDLMPGSGNLDFFYGAGIHGGFIRWTEHNTVGSSTVPEVKTRPIVGIDGVAGLEYTFSFLPVCAGIEIKPPIDFLGRTGFKVIPWDFGFTLRYLF